MNICLPPSISPFVSFSLKEGAVLIQKTSRWALPLLALFSALGLYFFRAKLRETQKKALVPTDEKKIQISKINSCQAKATLALPHSQTIGTHAMQTNFTRSNSLSNPQKPKVCDCYFANGDKYIERQIQQATELEEKIEALGKDLAMKTKKGPELETRISHLSNEIDALKERVEIVPKIPADEKKQMERIYAVLCKELLAAKIENNIVTTQKTKIAENIQKLATQLDGIKSFELCDYKKTKTSRI